MSGLIKESIPSGIIIHNLAVPYALENEEAQKESNLQIVEKLKFDFGSSVIEEVWNKILPHLQERFLEGKEALEPHEQQLRRGGFRILLSHLKGRYINILERGIIPEAVIQRWLFSQSPQKLQSFIRNEELFTEALISEEQKHCQQISAANARIIGHFKRVYSEEVVHAVYEAIALERREGIEKGTTSLAKFLHAFRSKCQELAELPLSLGTLPEKNELIDFLQTAKVEKYAEGAQGVYFITGKTKEAPLTVVAKVADRPVQEWFATRLLAELSIKTPSIHILDKGKEPEASFLLHQLLQGSSEYRQRYGSNCQDRFILMGAIRGAALEQWESISSPGVAEQVFIDIGEIAASDLLLYQRDRLPMIGITNLGNIMIVQDEEKGYVGSAAIDQAADLQREMRGASHFSCDPFERIRVVVSEMMADPHRIDSGVQAIYEEALPQSLKEGLQEDVVLKALQKGVFLGLSKIVTCSFRVLEKLHAEISEMETETDRIDLQAYQLMLRVIQEVVLNLN